MNFSPEVLARVSVEAFIWGTVLGILSCVTEYVRALISHHPNRFPNCLSEQKLPFIGIIRKNQTDTHRRKSLVPIITFFLDFLLCFTAAVGILLLGFVGNEGRIRSLFFIMALGGFFGIRAVGRTFIIAFLRWIWSFVYIIIRYIAFFLLWPVRRFGRTVRKCIHCFQKRLRQYRTTKKEQRFREKEFARLFMLAKNGFGCLADRSNTPFDLTKKG